MRSFELTEEEENKFDEWRRIKIRKLQHEAIGGAFSFIFTPTLFGTVVTVKCVDGDELQLSDGS